MTNTGLHAIDPLAPKTQWSMVPTIDPHKTFGSAKIWNPGGAPVIRSSTIFAVFGGKSAGTGTGRDRNVIQLIATDAGDSTWDTTIDLGADGNSSKPLSIAGVTDTSIVITTASMWGLPVFPLPDSAHTWVIDRTTHQVRWERAGMYTGHVDNDTLVGIVAANPTSSKRGVLGLSLSDGSQRWQKEFPGYTRMFIQDIEGMTLVDSEGGGLELISTVTGDALYRRDRLGALTCHFDELKTVVCQPQVGDSVILAFDITAPGSPEWEFATDGAREAPTVTAAYHGLIYGHNSKRQGVVLDASTGQDAPDPPGFVPVLANEYVGIAEDFSVGIPTK
ncbi:MULTISPECIES: hypothetical protein [unclassified Nocardia]|uniref:hypothetical protein n=1 Tax=unclassified Nocardia TaxID=2637762 RepID=UPI00278C8C81|nr:MULTISPECIES: hypothetical protein [unclassified Nocardia]